MTTLRATTTATLWPRQLLLTDPYRGWQLIERSDENLATLFALATHQPCDPSEVIEDFCSATGLLEDGEQTPAQQIRHLDQLYTQCTAGLAEIIELDAALASSFNQRLRIRSLSEPTPLSLPTSVARLARIIRAQGQGPIYLDSDVNGLSLILSHTHRVTARCPSETQHQWLSLQLEAEDLAKPPSLLQREPAPNDHQLSLCYATTPHQTHQSIERGREALGGNGIIALLVRRPHDQWLHGWLQQEGVTVLAAHREIDHWLIPEGFCADYPGDLILLQCPDKELTAPSAEPRDQIIEQPALIIDIHRLSKARLTPDSLTEFADLLSGLSPYPEASRAIQTGPELWTLSWYDESAAGLTLELRPREQHAYVSLMPFELGLERAFIHAALLTWADAYTSIEPVRTYWCGGKSVFA
jgi:hypothetical protein